MPVEANSDKFCAMRPSPLRITKSPVAGFLTLILLVAACSDSFAAFLLTVPETPSEATLFDFTTGRLQDPSAFDVVGDRPVRVDQTNQWDFLFRVVDGVGEFVPFSALADSVTEAGIRTATEAFEGILEAPRQGYESSDPVPVGIGDVIFVRSRRNRTQILICNQFLKLEILDLDVMNGSITFRYLRNPNCGDTVLEPGQHGEL